MKDIVKKREDGSLTIFEWFENNSNFKSFKSQNLNIFKSQSQ